MMQQGWQRRWTGGLAIAALVVGGGEGAIAQIVPDNTLGTRIGGVCNGSGGTCAIGGGTQRGGNLFHSFQQFSLPNGDLAGFIVAPTVQNAIVRVTGQGAGFVSTINGTIATFNQTNTGFQLSQPVNFFLMNPNGITFGANARLFIGGSFLATTADRMVFQDGTQFSTSDPAPLFTVSVPIGLQFGRSPGNIQMNDSILTAGQNSLFRNFALVGGDVSFEGATVIDPGQRVELGGVAQPSVVGLKLSDNSLSLSFSEGVERANVSLNTDTLNQPSFINVIGSQGSINVNARSISILNSSQFLAGLQASDPSGSQAGNISLNATDTITFNGPNSIAANVVGSGAVGNGGKITIEAGSLSIKNGAGLTTTTLGQGDAGDIIIHAHDGVSIDGTSNGFDSGILSRVGLPPLSTGTGTLAQGKGGNITIETGFLSVTNGGDLDATTFGIGDAGNISIQAQNAVSFSGTDSNGKASYAFSTVGPQGNGRAGDIAVTAASFSMDNGALLATSLLGQGSVGNILIKTQNSVTISSGAQILADTEGQGNAGNILIQAGHAVTLDGKTGSNGLVSAILADVAPGAVGRGGDIALQASALSLTNGSQILARAEGQGNAGNVNIAVSGNATLDGSSLNGRLSGVSSQVDSGAIGNGGNVFLTADSLSVTNGAELTSSTFGQGNAGNVKVTVAKMAIFDGVAFGEMPSDDRASGEFSNVGSSAIGNGGDVELTAGSLTLSNGAELSTSTFGKGDAGNVKINVVRTARFNGFSLDSSMSSGAFSTVHSGANGNGGNVDLTAGSLSVTNGAALDASTAENGNAGSVKVNVSGDATFNGISPDGQFISAAGTVGGSGFGKGGDIELTANSLHIMNGAFLIADTFGQGNAGSITLNVNSLFASSGGNVQTITFGSGNAGNIFINAHNSIMLSDAGTGIFASTSPGSSGNGGSIVIDPSTVTLQNEAAIGVNSQGSGRGGDITIQANQIMLSDQSLISAETASNQGGNITLNLQDLLLLRQDSLISTSAGTAQAGGNGGNININAPKGFLVTAPNENNDITANAFNGSGGRVTINAYGIFWFTPRSRADLVQLLGTTDPAKLNPQLLPTNDITAISQDNPTLNGAVTINTPEIDPSRGLTPLPTALVDASSQIAQRCPQRGSSQEASSFYIIGRGGLPLRPGDAPLSDYPTGTVQTIAEQPADSPIAASVKTTSQTAPSSKPIVEAQGWAKDANGNIRLIAQTSPTAMTIPWLPVPQCH